MRKPIYDTAIIQLERKYLDDAREGCDGPAEVLNEAARTLAQLKRALNPAVPPPERPSEIRVGAQSWQESIFYSRSGDGVDILDWQPGSPRFPRDGPDCQHGGGGGPRGAGFRSLMSLASCRRSTGTPPSMHTGRRYLAAVSGRVRGSSTGAAAGGGGGHALSLTRGAAEEAQAHARPATSDAFLGPRAPAAAAPNGRGSTPLRQSRGRHLHPPQQPQPAPAPPGATLQHAASQASHAHCSEPRQDDDGAGAAGPLSPGHRDGGRGRAPALWSPHHPAAAWAAGSGTLAGSVLHPGYSFVAGSIQNLDSASGAESGQSSRRATGTGSDPREELAAAAWGAGGSVRFRERTSTGTGCAAAEAEAEAEVEVQGEVGLPTPRRGTPRPVAFDAACGGSGGDSPGGSGSGSGPEEQQQPEQPAQLQQGGQRPGGSGPSQRRSSRADEAIREFARTAYEPGEGRQSLLTMLTRDGSSSGSSSPRPLMHSLPYEHNFGHRHGHRQQAQQQPLAPVPRAVPRHVAEAVSAMLPSSGRGMSPSCPESPAGAAGMGPRPQSSVLVGHASNEANLPWLASASASASPAPSSACRGRFTSETGAPGSPRMRPRRPSVTEGLLRHSWQAGPSPQAAAIAAAAAAALTSEDRPLLAQAQQQQQQQRGRSLQPRASCGGAGGSGGGGAGGSGGGRFDSVSQSAGMGEGGGGSVPAGGKDCQRQQQQGHAAAAAGASGVPPRVPATAQSVGAGAKAGAAPLPGGGGGGGADTGAPAAGTPPAAAAPQPTQGCGGGASASHRTSTSGGTSGGGSGSSSGGLLRGYASGGVLDHRMLDAIPRIGLDAPRVRIQVPPAKDATAARASGGGGPGHVNLHADAAALAAAANIDFHAELRRGLLAAPPGLAGVLHGGSRPGTVSSEGAAAASTKGGNGGPAAAVESSIAGRFARARRASVGAGAGGTVAAPTAPTASTAAPPTSPSLSTATGGRGGMLVTRKQLDSRVHVGSGGRCSGAHTTVLGMRGSLTETADGASPPRLFRRSVAG